MTNDDSMELDIYRLGESAFDSPVTLGDAPPKRSKGYAGLSCPLREGMCLSAERQQAIIAAVVLLLSPCSPTAIIRSVIRIIIDSVKCAFPWGARTHICIKGLKAIAPPFTDANSPSAIVMVHVVFRVIASSFHVIPHCILNAIRETVTGAKSLGNRANPLSLKTPAADVPFDAARRGSSNISTLAAVEPIVPPPSTEFLGVTIADYGAAAVSLAYEILNRIGDWIRIVISHLATPVSLVVRKPFGVPSTGGFRACLCPDYTTGAGLIP